MIRPNNPVGRHGQRHAYPPAKPPAGIARWGARRCGYGVESFIIPNSATLPRDNGPCLSGKCLVFDLCRLRFFVM